MKKIFKKSGKPFIVLTPAQASKLTAIFEYLLEEYNGHLSNKDEMIATKVLELLLQSDRYIANAESEQNGDAYSEYYPDSFQRTAPKLQKTERSERFYAEACMHPNHLNFLMKKYTGMTAKHTITDHIFLEAKHLLSSTSSIKGNTDWIRLSHCLFLLFAKCQASI